MPLIVLDELSTALSMDHIKEIFEAAGAEVKRCVASNADSKTGAPRETKLWTQFPTGTVLIELQDNSAENLANMFGKLHGRVVDGAVLKMKFVRDQRHFFEEFGKATRRRSRSPERSPPRGRSKSPARRRRESSRSVSPKRRRTRSNSSSKDSRRRRKRSRSPSRRDRSRGRRK